MSFFAELKRRNVVRVGIAYVVVAWLVLQVADILFEAIGTPGWVMQTLLVFLAIGFLLAVLFAWAFEMTPEGIKREHNVDRAQSIAKQTGRKLDFTIIGLLVVALAYFIWESRLADRPVVEPVADSVRPEATETIEEPEIQQQSIAVLPFENRSRLEEDEFFVAGIHDDLLTNLARIGDLKVISRTSVTQYRDTTKRPPEIAAELGVAHIMEGAVQRSGDTVRINVQLIDAATDDHIWAEIYDRQLTAENLFTIQSEISQAIADELEATLSPEEQERIHGMPTANLAAYDAYLKGRQLMVNRNSIEIEQAINQFRQAIELDPQFALAWVGLADSTALLEVYGTLDADDAFPISKDALDRALAIDPNLGEAYASLGSYYSGIQNTEASVTAFEKAITLSPGYATAWHWYANATNRTDQLDKKLALAQKAAELDPRSAIISANLAAAYQDKGLYSLSEQQYLKLQEIHPDSVSGHLALGQLYGDFLGRTSEALEQYTLVLELDPNNTFARANLAWLMMDLGDIRAMELIRDQIAEIDPDSPMLGQVGVLVNLVNNNPEGARENLEWTLRTTSMVSFERVLVGLFYLALGDEANAHKLITQARPGLLNPEQWPEEIAMYPWLTCDYAWILMRTGDPETGEQLLGQTIRYLEDTLPRHTESIDVHLPEVCYLVAGDINKALGAIEEQLANNFIGYWTVFHAFPFFDQIRHEPRYLAAQAERQRRLDIQRANAERMREEGRL
jgi:TolB-like protein/Tfp pilus assembly protein PilF